MRFEQRDLEPYERPVAVAELRQGSIYFNVTFADDDMHIPTIMTLVYVGLDLDEGDVEGTLYFQDIDSYQEGIRFGAATEGDQAMFIMYTADNLNNVFEFERALECLMRCSLRRRGLFSYEE